MDYPSDPERFAAWRAHRVAANGAAWKRRNIHRLSRAALLWRRDLAKRVEERAITADEADGMAFPDLPKGERQHYEMLAVVDMAKEGSL